MAWPGGRRHISFPATCKNIESEHLRTAALQLYGDVGQALGWPAPINMQCQCLVIGCGLDCASTVGILSRSKAGSSPSVSWPDIPCTVWRLWEGRWEKERGGSLEGGSRGIGKKHSCVRLTWRERGSERWRREHEGKGKMDM
eukprot:667291-Rhodomonas_salina.2